ncbi:unnamed protein product, partial [Protopolystoma xenopodis]
MVENGGAKGIYTNSGYICSFVQICQTRADEPNSRRAAVGELLEAVCGGGDRRRLLARQELGCLAACRPLGRCRVRVCLGRRRRRRRRLEIEAQ